MLQSIGFYSLAVVAMVAAGWLVSSRNLLHAVLALGLTSLAVAGLMLTLAAEFLAFVLVLVYVGAVVVIAAFAVMLTGHFSRPAWPPSNELSVLGGATALALAGVLVGVVLLQPPAARATLHTLSIGQMGKLLLTTYMLPFELVSVLLLAALVGAMVLARGQED